MLRAHGISSGTFLPQEEQIRRLGAESLQRLKQLERVNSELKNIGDDQALDIRILKDVNSKNW